MTISNPDIVRVIEARLADCRCYGLPVDPEGFKPCGGCEHDKHCLDEIVRLRAERDEARRGECSWHRSPLWFASHRGWDCFKEEPRWNSDPNIISLDELARCTRNQTP